MDHHPGRQPRDRETRSFDRAPAILADPLAVLALHAWIAKAEGDDLDLLLRTLDVAVTVTRERVEVAGVVPVDQAGFATIGRTSA